MNDDRAVEAMAEALHDEFCDKSECDDDLDGFARWKSFASKGLAALRAEGFDLYRVEDSDLIVSRGPNDAFGFAPGRYRLVPVGGEG